MLVASSHKLLYVLIHGVYTILELIWRTIACTYKICKRIHYPGSMCVENVDQIQRRLSKISKKPQHLTIIIGVEKYTLIDLANIVFWCMLIEIPFVSFYDYKGNLKHHEEKLQQVVNSKKPKNINIIWHTHSKMQHKNGFSGQKIHVKILTENDGRQNIVNVTKKLASSKDTDISVEKISEHLQKQYEFPDPEVAIMCGKTLNIYNYPPWQIRLTEFFKINSLNNITLSNFLENLEKYNKCEQRVGK